VSTLEVVLLYARLIIYPTLALLLFLSSTGEKRRLLSRRFRLGLSLYFWMLTVAGIFRFSGHLDWGISLSDWLGTPILIFLLLNNMAGVWQMGRRESI